MTPPGHPNNDSAPERTPDPTHDPNWERTPRWLAEALASATEPTLLLDCREPDELAIARFPNALHIPMGEIGQRIDEIEDAADALADAHDNANASDQDPNPDDPDPQHPTRIVVACHTGRRSFTVAVALRNAGLTNTYSLAGGIDWWSRQIDPSVPRY
ncbi:MAG: rhodanese-like domain-containing protein [Phycisphaerales bacterium]